VAREATAALALQKGEIDMFHIRAKETLAALKKDPNVSLYMGPSGVPKAFITLNTEGQFKDVRVRRAMLHALDSDLITETVGGEMATRACGLLAPGVYEAALGCDVLPKYAYDPKKAKQLLTEAGFPNGFKTTLSFDLSEATVREPTAVLIKESLEKIGVEITIEKVPGSNWFAQMASKSMPFVIAEFYGWLDYPEYHFFWTFHGGNNSVFNTANYVNPTLDKSIDAARFATNDKVYKDSLQNMVNIVMTDMPRIPLYRKFADYAVQPNVKGFEYWFHTHPDFRKMYKE